MAPKHRTSAAAKTVDSPFEEEQEERSVSKEDKVTPFRSIKDSGGADTHDALEATLSDASVDSRSIGNILVEAGKLTPAEAEKIAGLQKQEGLYFGEAAQRLKLVADSDIQYALARQFNYQYVRITEGIFSDELVAAYDPFGKQAEVLRGIRSYLLLNWLTANEKIMAVVSPGEQEGRSYVAANLAVMFAQQSRRTLLIDADLRHPRQHEIFNFRCRVGLSAMLAGRVRRADLEHLPESIPFFTHLSVLGAGAPPPNPLELLASGRLSKIISELDCYYDIIIIDSPASSLQADVQPIASAAHSTLMVARKDHTKLVEAHKLQSTLKSADVKIVGAVLNDF